MNKSILFASMACLALTACSNEDFSDQAPTSPKEITFGAEVMTRGSEMTTGSLNSIYVTALSDDEDPYFLNTEFIRENGEFHAKQGKYLWPSFHELKFYAYAPSLKTMGNAELSAKDSQGNNQLIIYNPEPSAKISEQVDFVTAVASSQDKEKNDIVPLRFIHNLAQIEVKAKNENDAYQYYILGVKLGNFQHDYNFDMKLMDSKDESPWSLNIANKRNYTIVYDGNPILLDGASPDAKSLMDPKTSDKNFGNAFIIPQTVTKLALKGVNSDKFNTGAYIGVLLQIRTKSSENSAYPQVFPNTPNTYAWAAFPIEQTFEAGHKYTFTINFTNTAGIVGPNPYDKDEITKDKNCDIDPTNNAKVDNDIPSTYPGRNILGDVIVIDGSVPNAFTMEDLDLNDNNLK